MAKKKERTRREMRSLRAQQIIFVAISIMIILVMVLSLVTTY